MRGNLKELQDRQGKGKSVHDITEDKKKKQKRKEKRLEIEKYSMDIPKAYPQSRPSKGHILRLI